MNTLYHSLGILFFIFHIYSLIKLTVNLKTYKENNGYLKNFIIKDLWIYLGFFVWIFLGLFTQSWILIFGLILGDILIKWIRSIDRSKMFFYIYLRISFRAIMVLSIILFYFI